MPSPSEWITRVEVSCLLTAPPLLGYRLLAIRMDMPLHQSNTHILKNPLEPLRLKATARCASRGKSRNSLDVYRDFRVEVETPLSNELLAPVIRRVTHEQYYKQQLDL